MADFALGPFTDEPGFDNAVELDTDDKLAHFAANFIKTEPDLIYLDGNSLGRQPIESYEVLEDVIENQWGERLIRSWNEGWWELQLVLGDMLAPLIGARPGETIISDSTSVNLYKLSVAAVRARSGRTRIITDDLNFPTDIYVLDGIARSHDMELVIVESDGIHGPVEALDEAIDETTALVSLSHTAFKSGYTYDLAQINSIAHEAGALVLWDTSHSVGSLPINFEETNTDLGIGCTYKYLNGGPGSPAFLYVRESLQGELENPITAWWGHARPFEFDLSFEPIEGIRKFHTGTMPMLSLAAVEPGLRTVSDAGMEAIRKKSKALTKFLIERWESDLKPLDFTMASPVDPERRGSHISLSHPEAWPLTRALIAIGLVIPDFRAPDSIRFGLSPLYTSFVDVHTAMYRLRHITESGIYRDLAVPDLIVT